MIIALEHVKAGNQANTVELHCSTLFSERLARVIKRLTGEHPVPVPIDSKTVAFFTSHLNLQQGCAVLSLLISKSVDFYDIDWGMVELEMQSKDE